MHLQGTLHDVKDIAPTPRPGLHKFRVLWLPTKSSHIKVISNVQKQTSQKSNNVQYIWGRVASEWCHQDACKWPICEGEIIVRLTSSYILCKDLLSLVGRGFFSLVSACFNLDLSNFVTSSRSGLSPIVLTDEN